MMNQNEEHEDMLFEEKKKKPEFREAGMDANGEFSMESLKRWFKRAGGALAVCGAAVCLMAILMAGKNQKESLIMEVNSDILMKFTMNRRGSVLSAEGTMARTNETVSMTAFEGKSLGIAVGKIFDRLSENNSLGEDGGILIAVRKSSAEVKASPEKIVKEVQKQTESELQKKESRATVYVYEVDPDADTQRIAAEYGITLTKAEFLKHLFAENPGLTKVRQDELAGYSSKRLIREINEQEYQMSLEPVVVKTTFEKASDETEEESTPEETTAAVTTEAASEQESGLTDKTDETETTENDGLSEMQRRRKALEAGESVDWVDQDTRGYRSDENEEEGDSSDLEPENEYGYRNWNRNSWEYGNSYEETRAPETYPVETTSAATVPVETAPVETAPAETAPPTVAETTAAPETTAASGMLTPETKTPAYLQGPGFDDPDNPRNKN